MIYARYFAVNKCRFVVKYKLNHRINDDNINISQGYELEWYAKANKILLIGQINLVYRKFDSLLIAVSEKNL